MCNEKGFCEIIVITLMSFIFIMIMLIFSIIILIQNIYTVSIEVKEDMYNVNRNIINSILKEKGKYDYFEINKYEYEQNLYKILISNYGLNNALENGKGMIQSIELIEYDFEKNAIYTKLKVKIKSPLLFSRLEKLKEIQISEKTKISKVKI